MTTRMPHPYRPEDAREFIGRVAGTDPAKASTFLIEHEREGPVGMIGLHQSGEPIPEMGYWIGKPYWNLGYCSEAAAAVVRFALVDLGLRRVFAHHFSGNPASGRVMQKIGMRHEGTLRRHTVKWGEVHDLETYGLLAGELIGTPDTRDP